MLRLCKFSGERIACAGIFPGRGSANCRFECFLRDSGEAHTPSTSILHSNTSMHSATSHDSMILQHVSSRLQYEHRECFFHHLVLGISLFLSCLAIEPQERYEGNLFVARRIDVDVLTKPKQQLHFIRSVRALQPTSHIFRRATSEHTEHHTYRRLGRGEQCWLIAVYFVGASLDSSHLSFHQFSARLFNTSWKSSILVATLPSLLRRRRRKHS